MSWAVFFLAAVAALPTAWMAFRGFRRKSLRCIHLWCAVTAVLGMLSIAGPVALPSEPYVLWVLVSVPFLWRYLVDRPLSLVAVLAGAIGLLLLARSLSSPEPKQAAGVALVVTAVAITLAVWGSVMRLRPESAGFALYAVGPLVAVQGLSMVVFRLWPELRWSFLSAEGMEIVLGDTVRRVLSGTASVNLLDDSKSGGLLFLNANRASMVMAVCAFAFAAWWVHSRELQHLLVAACAGAGLLASGSKTPLLAVPLVVLLLIVARLIYRRANWSVVAAVVVGGILALVAAASMLFTLAPQLLERIQDSTIQPRLALWSTALDLIAQYPLGGVGVGGWEPVWQVIAVRHRGFQVDWPPHNFFLQISLDAGILAGMLAASVGVVAIVLIMRSVRKASSAREAVVHTLFAAAWLWMWVHGMADNTSFYGTVQTVGPLGIGLGYALAAPGLLLNRKR